MKVLVDTNILARCSQANSSERESCLRALDRLMLQGHELFYCAQVAIEFWAVATRPTESNGLAFTIAQAEAALLDADSTMDCLTEPPNVVLIWRELANRHEVRGKKVHDARLVAFMIAHGLDRILTLNTADFARYSEITTLHPTAV